MSVPRATSWSGILVEGVVIVASILLAFGVDAWWDDRMDRQLTREHLQAVRIELLENERLLDQQAAYCTRFRSSTAALLSLMGPSPEMVSPDSLTILLSGALSGRVGTRLSTTALDAMIAQGHFASIRSAVLRQDLAEWLSIAVDQRIQQRDNTRILIREAQDYAQTILPFGLIGDSDFLGVRHESRFGLDVGRVLADATLEGAIVRLAGWRGVICASDHGRRRDLKELVVGIDAELSR